MEIEKKSLNVSAYPNSDLRALIGRLVVGEFI